MDADSSGVDWTERQQQTLRSLQRRLVEHIKAGRTTDMADAPMANPAGVYADPLRHEAERQKLFLELPLVAGLSGDIPNTGDTLVFDGAGRAIIVVRDAAGRANAFLNMCRHRGARLVNDSGCHARFTCPFHSWSFDLNGRLVGQPGKPSFEGLDAGQLGLVQVPCAEWHGLIFVKAQPGSGPIDVAAHLGSFAPELAEIGLESFAPVKSGVMKANGNWKYVLETFGESYHLGSLHPTTLANTIFSNVLLFDRFAPHHRIGFAPRSYGELVDKPEGEWPELYNVLYMIFPNTAMLLGSPMPGHMFIQLFRIFPNGISATDTHFTLYAPADSLNEQSRAVASAGFDLARGIIESEDFSVADGAQRNLLAAPPGFKVNYGRNEVALQHLHRDLAAAIGMPL